MMGNPSWLPQPVQLHSSRTFVCDPLTAEQCAWYKQRWHYWYIADHVFALPTIAFFMCAIGIFIIGHFISATLGCRRSQGPLLWQKLVAVVRYLSYRGFHVKSLKWNSAPVGILLLGLAGTIFFFCMDLIPQPYYWSSKIYGNSPALATRSGWLSLACMPFIFATASKTNWITLSIRVSYERLQVFHRWISYAFFVLALMHTFPFIVYHIRFQDMQHHFSSNLVFYWTGIVALIFQAWLTFASHSTIRNLGYEFFKMTHFIAVVLFMLTFFWHCGFRLSSWDYFIATAAVYVPCYVYPWLRTYFEYGVGQKAQLLVEDNGFIRITVPVKFNWKPGQHCFLRFTSFGLLHTLSSHPFTICSLPAAGPNEQSELVFYIRQGSGLTARLQQYALGKPGSSVPVLIDGPYGGINEQQYYDGGHLLVIAGGSGAGWCFPFIEQFARQRWMSADEERGQTVSTDGKSEFPTKVVSKSAGPGPLSLRVIMVTRDINSRTWFLRTINELLAKSSATDSSSHIDVQVYLTGPDAQNANSTPIAVEDPASKEPDSLADDKIILEEGHRPIVPEKAFQGRPQLPQIIHEEATRVLESGQSLNVYVCGPTTMQNDVRNAAAEENLNIITGSKAGQVYFHAEHFSWA
ncbi:ferric-chelate reductase [Trichoderma guizhouense]|uniref:ferric-chelate reductase (NADPH) n=1 Tax=Trichoderma guizhouense TaxID=1491466 RepID=A0A1T3CJM3_9HYPO|nr:ferric-chelate reductase [Trichoderma guizhouense]